MPTHHNPEERRPETSATHTENTSGNEPPENSSPAGSKNTPAPPNLFVAARQWVHQHPLLTTTFSYIALYFSILQPGELLRAFSTPEPDLERLAVALAAFLPVLLLATWCYGLYAADKLRQRRRSVIAANLLCLILVGAFVRSSFLRIAAGAPPKVNPNALVQFRIARAYDTRPDISEQILHSAEHHYLKAVELEPTYALAHAYLAKLHARIAMLGYDRSTMRLDYARASLAQAKAHNPDLPHIRLAAGYYLYWGLGDYKQAEREFLAARTKLKNDPDVYAGLGYIQRRQGRWEEGLNNLARAARLDPLNADRSTEVGHTYSALYCHANAVQYYRTALSMASDAPSTQLDLAYAYLRSTGRLDSLLSTTARLSTRDDPDGDVLIWKIKGMVLNREYPRAIRLLVNADQDLFRRQNFIYTNSMLRGLIYHQAGRPSRAQAPLDSARVHLETMLSQEEPDPRIYASLALVRAALGDTAQAAAHADSAIQVLLSRRQVDALDHPDYQLVSATVFTMNGRHKDAIAMLQKLVRTAGGISIHELRVDPVWEPLRAYAEFRRLLSTPQLCMITDGGGRRGAR